METVFIFLKFRRQKQERFNKKDPLVYGPLSTNYMDHTRNYEVRE